MQPECANRRDSARRNHPKQWHPGQRTGIADVPKHMMGKVMVDQSLSSHTIQIEHLFTCA